jgi:hypothetical protein
MLRRRHVLKLSVDFFAVPPTPRIALKADRTRTTMTLRAEALNVCGKARLGEKCSPQNTQNDPQARGSQTHDDGGRMKGGISDLNLGPAFIPCNMRTPRVIQRDLPRGPDSLL